MSLSEYYEGNSDGNNALESFSSLGTVTIHFKAGTDDASNRYVPPKNHVLVGGDGASANGFVVTPDKQMQVVGVNGQAWKNPKTVNADTNFGITRGIRKMKSITLEILNTNTTVNILVLG